jgi:peptide/nickel transport system substrate-binding protein
MDVEAAEPSDRRGESWIKKEEGQVMEGKHEVERARIGRREFLRRGALLTGTVGLASVLGACGATPTATVVPTAVPTKPAVPTMAPAAALPTATTAKATGPTVAPTQAPSKAAAEPKGTITIVNGEEPPNLSSGRAQNINIALVVRNMYEALLNRDPVTNELVPELATKWEVANETTWRFTLRKGVKFHDGTAFNAEAAAFAVNFVWSKDNNFLIREIMGPQISAVAVDEFTLDVTTEKPDPVLPGRLYFSCMPSMKHLKEDPEGHNLKSVGTGPYRFVEWAKGQYIKMTANTDWWGRSAGAEARGALTIKDIVFVAPRPEVEVRAGMVKAGEADLARWITKSACESTAQCLPSASLSHPFMRMDLVNPALKDRRVREAIALAVDKKSIMETILAGGVLTANFVVAGSCGFNPDLQPYPYDPNKAKQLIADAKAAGVPVDTPLTFYARQGLLPGINEAAEAITDMLKKAGLNMVGIKLLETAIYDQVFSAPKPIPPERGMVTMHLHTNSIMDLSRTASAYFVCSGPSSTVCFPEFEDLYNKALPLAGTERDKAFQFLAKRVHEEVAMFPVGRMGVYFGASKRLQWKPRLDGFLLVKEMTLKE